MPSYRASKHDSWYVDRSIIEQHVIRAIAVEQKWELFRCLDVVKLALGAVEYFVGIGNQDVDEKLSWHPLSAYCGKKHVSGKGLQNDSTIFLAR